MNGDFAKKRFISMKSGKIIGIALMILSIAFIAKTIAGMDIGAVKLQRPGLSILYLLIFSVIYTVSVATEGYAWNLILEFLHGDKIPYETAIQVYGKSNIAKYLPGNVLHYAGRNLMGARLGWNHSDIIMSSILEIGLAFGSAAIFALLFAHKQFFNILQNAVHTITSSRVGIILAIFAFLALIGIVWAVASKAKYREKLKRFFTKKFGVLFARTFLVYAATFFIRGMLLVLIFVFILNIAVTTDQILIIITASILSWMAGFITIGAPGGLGVRESVLILMLASLYGKENIVVAALLHRLVSVLGDAAAFALVLLLPKLKEREE